MGYEIYRKIHDNIWNNIVSVRLYNICRIVIIVQRQRTIFPNMMDAGIGNLSDGSNANS